jgi:putative inorganic carbon (hco3(-)) transporter
MPAHNPLLEVGADTGLFGIFVYLSIWVTALWQFFRCRSHWYLREKALAPYFPMVLGAAAGYFMSYIKDGGTQCHPTFFLLLALLVIPSQLLRNHKLAVDPSVNPPAGKPYYPAQQDRFS